MRRRDLLTGSAVALLGHKLARSEVISGKLPWHPDASAPPPAVKPEGWAYFTADEAATVEALVDRIIPPDPETPGGKDAGCAVFIDRQLAGGYGRRAGLYTQGPFEKGAQNFGPQGPDAPAAVYRKALKALDQYVRAHYSTGKERDGQHFAHLTPERQDEVLKGIEEGKVSLEGVDTRGFFEELLKDTQQGFFADPIYGGNRDMCAWKMIGYPGARYDYRDWVKRHNEHYPYPPVSIQGRADWTPES